ncbi:MULTISPECIES: bis(5'-nucleosyl)-tetraphosphatase PrpE [Bacillus]|uniref:bis(5'-nucleosyl)-tetraphosphatase PrpE n=1 Tax=Bacillus TaxID=1386 RepID=UPI0002FB100B|nr:MULTISPECIES: bis(5'-nucleosyl)-tetraphosphatase PrpE [Bacillus]
MKIDIIGDIHGCLPEFEQLTTTLGYNWSSGIPIHPEGRKLAFVGDLTDRGPQSIKVIEIVFELVKKKRAFYSPGNHCNKLYRYFLGRNVSITHGLETTVAEYKSLSPNEQKVISDKFIDLYENSPLYQVLDEGKIVIAHAGIRADYIGRTDKKVKTFVLYGDITGQFHPDGHPIRRNWAKYYKGSATIVYGHTPVIDPFILNNTYNIDTGCVFGGKLTALRYPEMKLVSVPSSMPYVSEKFRDLDE